jgi:hypothetical protein
MGSMRRAWWVRIDGTVQEHCVKVPAGDTTDLHKYTVERVRVRSDWSETDGTEAGMQVCRTTVRPQVANV